MHAVLDWIAATELSRIVLDSRWLWPVSESIHFMGLVLLAGTIGMFDLRVLGVAKGFAPPAIHRLVPFGLGGFGLSIGTGILFIAGTPDQYFYNSAFHLKLVFLVLMAANAAYFYGFLFSGVRSLGAGDDTPRAAKLSATLSLLFLVAVMCCGRMLTFFRPP